MGLLPTDKIYLNWLKSGVTTLRSILSLMKTLSCGLTIGLMVSCAIGVKAQAENGPSGVNNGSLPPPTQFRVVSRGANHQVWQRETYEQAPDGTIIPHIHKYTELASGLNYKDANGQWQESKEEIESYPGGAIA